MNDQQRRYVEGLRRMAALAQSAAERHDQITALIEKTAAAGLEVDEMREHNERARRFIQQVGAVQAAQALAYTEMIAAGGLENSRAYVEYEAASRRNAALLPQDKLNKD